MLWGVQCNAALMLDEGRSEEEIVRYLVRWALMDEERARRVVPSLRRSFAEAYVFCYHGRKLLEPGMRGPDSDGFTRRLLTEQVLPSDLGWRGQEPTPAQDGGQQETTGGGSESASARPGSCAATSATQAEHGTTGC